jgi:hypothetical protein
MEPMVCFEDLGPNEIKLKDVIKLIYTNKEDTKNSMVGLG